MRRRKFCILPSFAKASVGTHSAFCILRQRRGATLLLALLILGSLVAASSAIAIVVVQGLRNVRAIDDATIASYAAESGVEDLLYTVRRREVRTALDGTGTFANGARWTRTVTTTVPVRYATLVKDAVEQVDLFDVSGDLRATGIVALEVTAQAPDPAAWLEATWVPWLDSGTWGTSVARALFGPGELRTPRTITLASAPTDGAGSPVAYRVRLRARTADVGPIAIRALDDAGQSVAIPSRIRAVVRGERGSSRTALAVELPPRTPVLPVFDYVVFSECDIVKGDAVSCP